MPRVIDKAIVDMLRGVTGLPWDDTTTPWNDTTTPWAEVLGVNPTFSIAYLVDIEFPDPHRLRFTTKLDNVEFNGDTFVGLGTLGDVSMPESDGELTPAEYIVSLSGISDEVLAAVSNSSYLNKKATAYIQFMDADYNDVGNPQLLWQGLTDGADIVYGKTSSVSLRIRDRLSDWTRAKVEHYTHGDQIRTFPDDKGFEFVAEIAARDLAWPEASWFDNND